MKIYINCPLYKKTLIFLFFIYINPLFVIANNHVDNVLNVHNIFLENGQIDDAVYAIVQDKEGFLWIGTDNGLRRYDGYQLKSFNHDPNVPNSLGTSLAINLFTDRKDELWVAGDVLSHYNSLTETFDIYNVSENKFIWTICEDKDGLLWLGGEHFGLIVVNPKNGEVVNQLYLENFQLSKNYIIKKIKQTRDGAGMWISTENKLFQIDLNSLKITEFLLPENLQNENVNIRDLLVDKKGYVWLATDHGILKIDPTSKKTIHFQSGNIKLGQLSTNAIWSVFEDSFGSLWFGTDKKGLHKYNQKENNFFYYPSSSTDQRAFPVSSIYNIFEDNQGNLWLSLNNFGVRRISPHLEKFDLLQHSSGENSSLSFNNVLDLHEDKDGLIYIGTDGGGLDKYDPISSTFINYKHDPKDSSSISSNSVLSIAEDKNNQLWIGTWAGGLNIFNKLEKKFIHIKHDSKLAKGEGLDNNNIFRVAIMADGRVMLSVWESGLQIYDPKDNTFESYFYSNQENTELGDINNSEINDFEFDDKGNVWIGGNSGLELFNPITRMFKNALLEDVDVVNDIFQVSNGDLWLGTSRGLFYYQPQIKALTHYDQSKGMSDDFVVSIEQDNNNDLWLGTRSGLIKFEVANKKFENFDQGDGLAGLQFNIFSHIRTTNGEMYFGGVNGITHFQPNSLPRNTKIPNIVFTEFELFQNTIIPSTNSVIKQSINVTKEITLDYNQRDITFEFSALNFVFPENNRYQYKLDGLEEEWTHVDSSRRRVRYTNLDPKEYTFMVMGSNNDNFWNTQERKIKLIIIKPWWMMWWTKLFLVSLIMLVVFLIFKWQSSLNAKRRLLLKKLVEDKTKELANANRNVRLLNSNLEERVSQRTKELSVEIKERKSIEEKLFHMAYHDSLTGLPNRSWLIPHLENLIKFCANKKDEEFALMFLDGDKFKNINDVYGHIIGDEVLRMTAKKLEMLLPDNFKAIRLGGDEFTVVSTITSVLTGEKIQKVANDIICEFQKTINIDNIEIPFQMSIGMVICDASYINTELILRDADIAMYKAKERGRGVYQLFDKSLGRSALETIELESDLSHALANGQLFLVYQPIVSFPNMKLAGFEALLRWKHPTKGYISPDKFIPIAEENGLIIEIGRWVLYQGCKQLSIWQKDIPQAKSLWLSINLSTKQLVHPSLISQVNNVLEETKLLGSSIKLEITESSIMEYTEDIERKLRELNDKGITIAIDDFGTGYSSLSYLNKLPIQYLKIDKVFVDSINAKQENSIEIIATIISLAHNLNIKVIAEGVETESQKMSLVKLGCEYGQGYVFEKPLSIENAKELILNGFDNLSNCLLEDNAHMSTRAIRK